MSLGKLNRPESLFEMALRELRSAIIDGRLKLGDQISESRISKMLGISKTPVREALQELRREGLVKIDPHRGTSVFSLSDEDIDDIGELRLLLEMAAARRIFAGDRTAAVRAMRLVIRDMHKATRSEDLQAYRNLDSDFHEVLIEHCRNRYIAEAYNLISAKIGALRTRAQDERSVVQSSLKMHTEMMELLAAGDEAAFCARLERHIRNTASDYRAWLQRDGSKAMRNEAVD